MRELCTPVKKSTTNQRKELRRRALMMKCTGPKAYIQWVTGYNAVADKLTIRVYIQFRVKINGGGVKPTLGNRGPHGNARQQLWSGFNPLGPCNSPYC